MTTEAMKSNQLLAWLLRAVVAVGFEGALSGRHLPP